MCLCALVVNGEMTVSYTPGETDLFSNTYSNDTSTTADQRASYCSWVLFPVNTSNFHIYTYIFSFLFYLCLCHFYVMTKRFLSTCSYLPKSVPNTSIIAYLILLLDIDLHRQRLLIQSNYYSRIVSGYD